MRNSSGRFLASSFCRIVPPTIVPQLCGCASRLSARLPGSKPLKSDRTHLGERAQEREERERVCAVRDGKRRQDGKLRTNPDDTEADAKGDLHTDVCRTGAVFVQDSEDAKTDKDESPSDVVLRAITAQYLSRESSGNRKGRNGEGEREEIDT